MSHLFFVDIHADKNLRISTFIGVCIAAPTHNWMYVHRMHGCMCCRLCVGATCTNKHDFLFRVEHKIMFYVQHDGTDWACRAILFLRGSLYWKITFCSGGQVSYAFPSNSSTDRRSGLAQNTHLYASFFGDPQGPCHERKRLPTNKSRYEILA